MGLNNSSYRSGHRERLRKKFLQNKLADYELLELLLSYAIPRIDVKPLARELITKYGCVQKVLSASFESLIENKGVKENAAVLIKMIHKMMILDYKNYLDDTPIFYDYKKLSEYCRLLLSSKQIEEFHILYLDSNYKLLSDDLHSSGTVDWAAVYTREIVKRALELNAHSVVMMHNHPMSGKSFSTDDIEITASLKGILSGVGIELFDHLLVSGDIVYSAKNMFLIK